MTSTSLEEDISELIQCTICIESLSDTRVLCCGHTFCLRCLQRYGKGKSAGDSVSCPVCRNRFQVPSGGFSSLPRNFLLEKILEIHAAAASSVVETSSLDDWMEESHPLMRGRISVAVQSTQTTVEEENPLVERILNEVEQVELQHQQLHGQQDEQQHPQEQQQQQQQTQQQQRHRQQRQQQQQLEQQRQQVHPNLVPQRRRPFASRKGWSQRILMNTFLASLVLNFLLIGNLWYIQDSMEQERTNWTYREFEFEDKLQKLKEESEDKQITINNHHLRCTERVESSLDECRNDLTFYKGFLQTVTKLLDSYTTPQQPTFSVM